MKIRKKMLSNLSIVTNRMIQNKLSWPVTIGQILSWHKALYSNHKYNSLFDPL